MSATLAFIGAILMSLAINEISDLSPWLAEKILRWSARRLRDPELTARYEEEWLADLGQVAPGSKLTKLGYAIGVALFGVVKLRARGYRLDWEPRSIVSPFERDSLFGPGNPLAASRPFTTPPGFSQVIPLAQPAPPMRAATPKPLGTEESELLDIQLVTDWSPPIGLPTRRRQEPRPQWFRNGFERLWDVGEDREHLRKYLVESDPDELFGTDEATPRPVIGY